MITTNVFLQDGKVIRVKPEEIAKYLKNKKNTLWVDLEQPTEREYDLILEKTFNFHPLSIADCKRPIDLPKIDVFDHHVFLVFHNASSTAEKGYFKKREVDFFLGENYLVSVHLHKSKTIDFMMEKVSGRNKNGKKGKYTHKTSDFLLYEMMDNFIDRYFPLLDTWDEELEDLELAIVKNKAPQKLLNKMMSIKREVLNMRKSIIPQRDVLNKISRQDFPFIRPKTTIYFKDAYDHIMLVYTELEIQRDLLNSAFEAQMSAMSNQMNTTSNKINQVMQKLTVITTIFMPLTFITGLYGMNFEHMPGTSAWYGFFIVIGISIIITAVMLMFFRKNKWF
jgi:magnesium transporter